MFNLMIIEENPEELNKLINIAKKYNKKVDTIYGNIKQATNYMLSECNENIIISYLGYSYYVKPKVQEIIFAILNKLE